MCGKHLVANGLRIRLRELRKKLFDTPREVDIVWAMVVKRMSHADRMQRRERMAREVRNHRDLGRVAAKFGVSLETVRCACRLYCPEKLVTRVSMAG